MLGPLGANLRVPYMVIVISLTSVYEGFMRKACTQEWAPKRHC